MEINIKEIPNIELQYLDTWFSNIVDTINYDLAKIEDAVPALSAILTTLDAAPIQYLNESFNGLVKSLNNGFDQINDKFRELGSRIEFLESKQRNTAREAS